MTGSGTLLDPYIILTVDDLQDMEDDLDAYYELGGDIDASATSGWNSGMGFQPIGSGNQSPYLVPQSDVGATGTWTVFPASPTTKWDKVADGGDIITYPESDEDATYIQCSTVGNAQFWLTSLLGVPNSSSVSRINMEIIVTKQATYNVLTTLYPGVLVGGTWYKHATSHVHPGSSYSYWSGGIWATNPRTGVAWTPDDLNGVGVNALQGFGFEVTVLPTAWVRCSTIYFEATILGSPFEGHFDGKGYTISDLYINRPYQDYVGLFGRIDNAVTIEHVTIEDCSIVGYSSVGSLVGSVGASIAADSIVMHDCNASGQVSGHSGVGGLIGADEDGGGGG